MVQTPLCSIPKHRGLKNQKNGLFALGFKCLCVAFERTEAWKEKKNLPQAEAFKRQEGNCLAFERWTTRDLEGSNAEWENALSVRTPRLGFER